MSLRVFNNLFLVYDIVWFFKTRKRNGESFEVLVPWCSILIFYSELIFINTRQLFFGLKKYKTLSHNKLFGDIEKILFGQDIFMK